VCPELWLQDVEWLKSITSLPILLKGIVTAEDARKAVEVGAAGVIVSNHGARQLDYAPPTISVLEEVTAPQLMISHRRGRSPAAFISGVRTRGPHALTGRGGVLLPLRRTVVICAELPELTVGRGVVAGG